MTTPPPPVTVFIQDKCLSHRYIRSTDTSRIAERPQRLRAVKTGVAAAIARLEEGREREGGYGARDAPAPDEATLSAALERLDLAEGAPGGGGGGGAARQRGEVVIEGVVEVVMSTAPSVDVLSHPAVDYVHGDGGGGGEHAYLARLVRLVQESEEKVARGESEIPDGLSQEDLYLCGGSLDAIQGGIGTVCEAVDAVLAAAPLPVLSEALKQQQQTASGRGTSRAFVVIRPPGHHCGVDTPSGFCFVNNVAIGAAHAHLKHGVTRVAILDIDLHHGNGTQSLVWRINEEARRQELTAAENPGQAPSLRVYYGSIHDALSYPCEDGDPAIIQAASVSIHGPHGQYIENVHLLTYESEEDFWDRLYAGPYASLVDKAEAFLKEDTSSGEAMIFISAGFDASEHETPKMSRHGRKLPTGFYRRFTRDVRALADKYARGRIVSVLEGGYSDRALCSGAMAHVLGLAERNAEVDESWWSVENLAKIETATKKRRGGRSSTASVERWVERTLSLLSVLDPNPSPPPTPKPIPPSTMTLRDRNKISGSMTPSGSESGSPAKPRTPSVVGKTEQTSTVGTPAVDDDNTGASVKQDASQIEEIPVKKLPRVLLRVNPPAPGHPPG